MIASLASISWFGFNWIDGIIILMFLYFLVFHKGILSASSELLGFVLAITLAYRLYPFAGSIIQSSFDVSAGIGQAIGFLVVWFVGEMIIHFVISFFMKKYIRLDIPRVPDRVLGMIPAGMYVFCLCTFTIACVFAFPVRPGIKESIYASKTGRYFIANARQFEHKVSSVFGDAIMESINFITIKPASDTVVPLGFSADEKDVVLDEKSENTMVTLVNKEREALGRSTLAPDPQLQQTARLYAEEMLIHGFFSHTSQVDKTTVSARAIRQQATFTVVGENLAYAPDVYLAHDGLMNSPGHKANIISPLYNRIGIGVIEAPLRGKMFVQVFAD